MIGQRSPLDPSVELADRIKTIAARVAELERSLATRVPWTDVTFQNSWFNYGSPFPDVQYRKIGDIVEIRGVARKTAATTSGEVLFQLPAGFRPVRNNLWSVLSYNAVSEDARRVDIASDGRLYLRFSGGSAGSWVSFHHAFSTT